MKWVAAGLVLAVLTLLGFLGWRMVQADEVARARVDARYTLCLEIRKIKTVLVRTERAALAEVLAFRPTQDITAEVLERAAQRRMQTIQDLDPGTPADCVKYAHLDDDVLLEAP